MALVQRSKESLRTQLAPASTGRSDTGSKRHSATRLAGTTSTTSLSASQIITREGDVQQPAVLRDVFAEAEEAVPPVGTLSSLVQASGLCVLKTC